MSKTPLVFVHGFLGSALNWGPILIRLEKSKEFLELGLKPIALDMLGHGQRSQIPADKNLRVEDLGRDLLDQIGDKPFFAVGHSFGLRPLLWIAGSHPKKIISMVVEDSSPVVSEQGFNELIQIFDKIKPPFQNRQAAKQAIEVVFGAESRLSRFLMTNMRATADQGPYDWRFNAAKLRGLLVDAYLHPQWEEWKTFPGKIALIMGADSKFVPIERQEESLRLREAGLSSLVRISQSGHWVHADQPDQFCDELLKVLKIWLV